jgi:hypothetical protein
LLARQSQSSGKIGPVFTFGRGDIQMITEAFITNMVIGVAIVVAIMMVVLLFQVYKTDDGKH